MALVQLAIPNTTPTLTLETYKHLKGTLNICYKHEIWDAFKGIMPAGFFKGSITGLADFCSLALHVARKSHSDGAAATNDLLTRAWGMGLLKGKDVKFPDATPADTTDKDEARDWQQESVHVAAGQQQDGQTDTRDSEAASGLQANDDKRHSPYVFETFLPVRLALRSIKAARATLQRRIAEMELRAADLRLEWANEDVEQAHSGDYEVRPGRFQQLQSA
ncbi:hypothetical protein WJX84_007221 [Apatococcus fuscideae]|uniref:Uncharacterized protein n=1 Tax=Apatococcus fuscideae TaxID=2026836 RepID=A0AAW1SZZ4_9CHLO